MFHPLDPFAELIWPELWAGGSGFSVSGTGYGLAFGFPRALVAGQKNGAGDFEGVDDGLLLANGLKGGQAETRSIGAPWIIAHAEKASAAGALDAGHPYLLGHGEKVVIAAIGYGLTYAHARALVHGAKVVPGYASSFGVARDLGHSQKGGAGSALAHDSGEIAALSEHGGEYYFENRGHARGLTNGLKTAPGYGVTWGASRLEVFGVKVGGGTVGEGFARTVGPSWLMAAGQHGGTGYGLSDAELRALVQALKVGTGHGFGHDTAFLFVEGLHGGQALNVDPVFMLSHGVHIGAGLALTRGHVFALADGSRVLVLYPIASKTGPAIYEPLFGAALRG